MARKQVTKTKSAPKKTPKKPRSAPAQKIAKSKSKTSKKTIPKPKVNAQKKAAAKKLARKRTIVKKAKSATILGRPRIAGTADVEDVFRKDLEAREICEFLGVRTLKELEAFSRAEIFDRLTSPIVQTIDRMRKTLAMNNRSLAGDQKFATAFQKEVS